MQTNKKCVNLSENQINLIDKTNKLIVKELKFHINHNINRQKSEPSSSLIIYNIVYSNPCKNFKQLAPLFYHKKNYFVRFFFGL